MLTNYVKVFKEFKSIGDMMTPEERLLFYWLDFLQNNTNFKHVSVNSEDITFESENRKFKLKVNEDYSFELSYYYNKLVLYNSDRSNDYSTPDDINANAITGDFITLRNWFKKRNYLKGKR